VAIKYIGAAPFLIARAPEKAGFDIRNSPEILSQAYHGHSPESWERKMSSKKPGERFELVPGSMGLWIKQNRDYLERAVGRPESQ
jgi:hypothetical protein